MPPLVDVLRAEGPVVQDMMGHGQDRDRDQYPLNSVFDGNGKPIESHLGVALAAMDDMFDDLGYLGTAIV